MTHPLKFLLITLFAFTLALPAHAFEAVTFKSGDGLEITGDPTAPTGTAPTPPPSSYSTKPAAAAANTAISPHA